MSLTIHCGDDDVITATVTQDGAALDLTGLLAAKFVVKDTLDDLDVSALITKTLGSGITVTNAVGGILTITLAAADTQSLVSAGVFFASLKLKDSGGKTHTVYEDEITLARSAARSAT